MKYVLKWCEQIQIISGSIRSCLLDLNRNNYELVPSQLFDLIKKTEGLEYIDAVKKLSLDEIEWLDHCIDKEYFLQVPFSLFHNFRKINFKRNKPWMISNLIFHENVDFEKINNIANLLCCKSVHIICTNEKNIRTIINKYYEDTNLRSIEFSIEKIVDRKFEFKDLLEDFQLISNIIIFDINYGKDYDCEKVILGKHTNSTIPKFIVNLEAFSESKNHHLFFNEKMYIDEMGNIKNSQESTVSFGNINDEIDIETIVKSNDFQNLWEVSKDKCLICKDCEFHRMCVDNRIPKLNSNGERYYLTECEYNPYLAKWKGTEGYLNLEDSGITFDHGNLLIDDKKLCQINETLWG